jgi:hypothetical protein
MRAFERYLLAVVPAQTVLAAEWLLTSDWAWTKRLWRVSLGLLAGAVIFICAFGFWFRLGVAGPVAGCLLAALLLWLGVRAKPIWPAALTAVLAMTVCFGWIYPRLGISAMPSDLEMGLANRRVVQFRSSQPSLLSMRLRKSVQQATPENVGLNKAGEPEEQIVFVEATQQKLFETAAEAKRLEVRELGRFLTFYSRKAWLRFARPDANAADWKAAFRSRSLGGLKSEVRYYLVRTPGRA